MQKLDSSSLVALARAHTPTPCKCALGACAGWESFTEDRWPKAQMQAVGTLRDPDEEKRTVATLISHNVDSLFVAGATDPDPLSLMCTQAGIAHINVDLPGSLAASVVTNNYYGASELTRYLIRRSRPPRGSTEIHFIGGNKEDFNTLERIRAFQDVLAAETGRKPAAEHITPCGYGPDAAEKATRDLIERSGALPQALFVNSTIAFEGVFRVLKDLPNAAFDQFSVGCFDWDPFLSHLHFPVAMVRQDAQMLIETAFKIIDEARYKIATVTLIKPELLFPSN